MTTSFDHDMLLAELIRDEGLRLKPYRDTAGKLTIGIGRNLDDVGITEPEARALAMNDIRRAAEELDRVAPWWRRLDPVRQRVLLNMHFNLGWPRLSQFRRFLAAAEAGRFDAAADEMLDSRWATQVGDRALRLWRMMRNGEA